MSKVTLEDLFNSPVKNVLNAEVDTFLLKAKDAIEGIYPSYYQPNWEDRNSFTVSIIYIPNTYCVFLNQDDNAWNIGKLTLNNY